jgi:hypothetical protein
MADTQRVAAYDPALVLQVLAVVVPFGLAGASARSCSAAGSRRAALFRPECADHRLFALGLG